MFKIGTKVVYPALGIGVIENIEKRQISDATMIFYIVRILENEMTVMVPKMNAEKVGLREIIPKREVPKVIKMLKEGSSNNNEKPSKEENWNRRYRDYLEKIKTGSVYEIAKVYRKLYLLKAEKDLSFGERQVFDNAYHLIVSEIALASGIAENKAEKMVQNAFVN